jgi:hypothetical protein
VEEPMGRPVLIRMIASGSTDEPASDALLLELLKQSGLHQVSFVRLQS